VCTLHPSTKPISFTAVFSPFDYPPVPTLFLHNLPSRNILGKVLHGKNKKNKKINRMKLHFIIPFKKSKLQTFNRRRKKEAPKQTNQIYYPT